jgi:mono/diheme cytochrome c family protein
MHALTMSTAATLLACSLGATAQAQRAPAPARPALLATAEPALLSPAGEGRRRYLALNCYVCHGMYAGGAMAPAIAHAEKGDVQEAVMQGEDTGMPSFARYVTQTDINDLTAYLQSIGGPNEPVFMDWWVKIPPK